MKICTDEGCTRQVYATGLCSRHYDEKLRRARGVKAKPVAGARSCTEDGCDRPMYAKGLCTRHYDNARNRAQGIPERIIHKEEPCSVEGCGKPIHSKGLCQPHYRQMKRRERGLRRPGAKQDPEAFRSRYPESGTPVGNDGRRPMVLYNFRLTHEQYQGKIRAQENKCVICGKEFTNTRDRHTDHAHYCCKGPRTCGQCTRDILCADCNRGIGNFHENIRALANAILYLEKWNKLIPIPMEETNV